VARVSVHALTRAVIFCAWVLCRGGPRAKVQLEPATERWLFMVGTTFRLQFGASLVTALFFFSLQTLQKQKKHKAANTTHDPSSWSCVRDLGQGRVVVCSFVPPVFLEPYVSV
jgi:hypothetical protein